MNMEINILESTKNRIKFEILGEDHTLCNALRKELWNNPNVEVSGYNIDHPLVNKPLFIVQTTSKEDPKKALLKAIESLKKSYQDLLVQVKTLK